LAAALGVTNPAPNFKLEAMKIEISDDEDGEEVIRLAVRAAIRFPYMELTSQTSSSGFRTRDKAPSKRQKRNRNSDGFEETSQEVTCPDCPTTMNSSYYYNIHMAKCRGRCARC
jgi:hypothetical protein